MSSASSSDAIRITSNDVQLSDILFGHGSFKQVFVGGWKGQEVAVAKYLNFLDPRKQKKLEEEFKRELVIRRSLNHENIVGLLAFCHRDQQNPAEPKLLVMERMDQDLEQLIKSTQLDLGSKVDLMVQISRGMKYLHENGVFHRDLKPANILVKRMDDSNGQTKWLCKVTDFGVSKVVIEKNSAIGTTGNIGTLLYTSPELFKKQSSGARSDVYSAAMTFFQLLTGRLPYDMKEEILMQSFKDESVRPEFKPGDGVPVKVKQVVQRMWSADKSKRPLFDEVIAILNEVMREMTKSAAGGGATAELASGSASSSAASSAWPSHARPSNVEEWGVQEVVEWLGELGLDKHEHIFIENKITGDVLIELTQEVVEDMGIKAQGDQIKLRKAIELLKRTPISETPSPAPQQAQAGGLAAASASQPEALSVKQELPLDQKKEPPEPGPAAVAGSGVGSGSGYFSSSSSQSLARSSNVNEWGVQEVVDWLGELGLGEHHQKFAKEHISGDVLVEMTEEYLEKMGIDSLGHRIKIRKAIESLKRPPTSEAPSPAPQQAQAGGLAAASASQPAALTKPHWQEWQMLEDGEWERLMSGVEAGERGGEEGGRRVDDAEAHVIRGWVHFWRDGEFDKSEAEFNKAIEIDKDCVDGLAGLALCHASRSKFDEAHKLLDQALVIHPNHLVSLAGLVRCLNEEGQRATSEEEKAAKLQQRTKYFKSAMQESERLVKINSRDTRALFWTSYCLHWHDESQKALEWLDRLLAVNNHHLLGRYYKGVCLRNLNRNQDAITCFDSAIQIDSKNVNAWNNKGLCLVNLNKHQAAITCFDSAIQIDPKNANAWNNKGVCLKNLNQHQAAITCFDSAIQIDPNIAWAWNNKGLSLKNLNQHHEAVTCFDRAIQIDPKLANAWYNKGWCLENLNRHHEAVTCLDRAIQIDPNNTDAWSNKGHCLAALNQHNEAITCLDRAIQIDPKNASAWFNKGICLRHLNRSGEAVPCFVEANRLEPNKQFADELKPEVCTLS